MLGKKMYSFKKLAKKLGKSERRQTQCESLLRESEEMSPSATSPTGFFALYVGDERERFVVPTSFLKHPLFKMLLEKSYNEFGLEQRDRLVVPCSVAAFQEVVSAVECFFSFLQTEVIFWSYGQDRLYPVSGLLSNVSSQSKFIQQI